MRTNVLGRTGARHAAHGVRGRRWPRIAARPRPGADRREGAWSAIAAGVGRALAACSPGADGREGDRPPDPPEAA